MQGDYNRHPVSYREPDDLRRSPATASVVPENFRAIQAKDIKRDRSEQNQHPAVAESVLVEVESAARIQDYIKLLEHEGDQAEPTIARECRNNLFFRLSHRATEREHR